MSKHKHRLAAFQFHIIFSPKSELIFLKQYFLFAKHLSGKWAIFEIKFIPKLSFKKPKFFEIHLTVAFKLASFCRSPR